MGLTQCGIVQMPHCTVILVRSVFRLPTRMLAIIASFSYTYISQGSVATPLWRGGIFTNHFTGNFPTSVPVKEF